ESEAGARQRGAPRPHGGTETVLLVEDDDLVRKAARRILELEGYRVLEAANGADALALAERFRGPIDLLLTDVVMPRMNGHDLACAVRAARPAIKVVYVTGYVGDAADAEALEATEAIGAYLRKPFSPAALLSK